MRVIEIMQTPVRVIGANESAEAAWEMMRRHRVHHLVVRHEGQTVGVISAGDLGGPAGDSFRKGRQTGELMTAKVVAATPETSVREAANLMRGHSIDSLPVFEGKKLKGIITTRDVLDLVGRGADRPIARAERRVLKHRGEQPRQQARAKRLAGAKVGSVRSR